MTMDTMKAYWNDCGQGPTSESPIDLSLEKAQQIWADGSAVEGNHFGLIDKIDNTIQFYFNEGIPDDVEDARHLKIVLVDFPVVAMQGSYSKVISIGEVNDMIAKAFAVGASHQLYDGLTFAKW